MKPTFSPFVQYQIVGDALRPIKIEVSGYHYSRTQVAEMCVALQRILEEYDAAEAERKEQAYGQR